MTQWGLTSSLVPDWVKWVRLVLRRSHPSTSVPYQPQIHLVSRHKLDFPFQTETTTLIGQTGDPGTWAKNDARKEREKKKKLIWGCVTFKHDMADDMGACLRHALWDIEDRRRWGQRHWGQATLRTNSSPNTFPNPGPEGPTETLKITYFLQMLAAYIQ